MGEGGGAPLHADLLARSRTRSVDDDAIVYDSHNPWERVWSLVHSGERGEPRGRRR